MNKETQTFFPENEYVKIGSFQILEEKFINVTEKYQKLLGFVRRVSYYIDCDNSHLTIKDAENLLKEIGEL